MNKYYVYILTNFSRKSLYIGVTSNIKKRIYEHKNKVFDGFTKKYNIDILIYFEECNDVEIAINREKQLKKWTRQKKENLIKISNPKMEEIII